MNIASPIIAIQNRRTSTHERDESVAMIAQPVVAADVEDVAAVRVTGDRLQLDLVQPVSDTDGQDVHSLRLQNQNQD